ncbi:replication protein A 70 kDa DNA-binding subunit B [Tanacetum coccineum]|uniref:Replication protein A 70 kDa DNA-binding subunit B n=1 Tax=Tanacetum coccineum TaxID=301880 RepID=A0ABQ5DH18_9ASTR
MEMNLTQLCDLDPMNDDTKILVRCISIWKSHPLGKPNEVWSLDAVLQDQQGNRVQISIKGKHISKFQLILDEGACYRIDMPPKQRKMGHITVVGPSVGIVEAQVKSFLKELSAEDIPVIIDGDDTISLAYVVSAKEELMKLKQEVAWLHHCWKFPRAKIKEVDDDVGEKLADLYEKLQIMGYPADPEMQQQIYRNVSYGQAQFVWWLIDQLNRVITVQCLYGVAPKGQQPKELEQGADIVVATLGRLNDILEIRKIDFHQVSLLVLDEADRMLDMGFEPQIQEILGHFFRKSI